MAENIKILYRPSNPSGAFNSPKLKTETVSQQKQNKTKCDGGNLPCCLPRKTSSGKNDKQQKVDGHDQTFSDINI